MLDPQSNLWTRESRTKQTNPCTVEVIDTERDRVSGSFHAETPDDARDIQSCVILLCDALEIPERIVRIYDALTGETIHGA